MTMSREELRTTLGSGLLSFPVTPFDADDRFNTGEFIRHLESLRVYPVAGLIVAGGTGELFSLQPSEVLEVVRAAKSAISGIPVIGGCGYGTKMACELAREAEQAGADGILLLPPYLVDAPQEGLAAHVRAVCGATKLGVIVYNRANCVIAPETLAGLAENCPNLVGFKDGTGRIDTVRQVTATLGDRLVYIGGMPTHELYAQAYHAAGVSTYSSAVFNFVPETALAFYDAVRAGDHAVCEAIPNAFFYPFAAIRNRCAGYAVSAIKAGVAARGINVGRVRPPLTDLTDAERQMLSELIASHR